MNPRLLSTCFPAGTLVLVNTLVLVSTLGAVAQAQLPASAVDLTKVKIPETQKSTDLCPVHLVASDPSLPTWTYEGVEYRGHTSECRAAFEADPQQYAEAARYQRWENNFVASMSPVWCPVTDEVSGGFQKWDKLGLRWESCCHFCNSTVNDNHFPAALERLKSRARLTYEKTGGVYAVGVTDPVADAIAGRALLSRQTVAPRDRIDDDANWASVPDHLKPGLRLQLKSFPSRDQDVRVARLPALFVAENEPVSPFLEPTDFQALWQGELFLEYPDVLVFSVIANGHVRLKINGVTAIEAFGDGKTHAVSRSVSCDQGLQRFELQYTRSTTGDGHVRVFWSGEEFHREPMPPTVFFHDPRSDEPLVTATTLRHGRALFAEYRCIRCHQPEPEAANQTDDWMRELSADAPSLDGIGSRRNRDWLVRWIDDPTSIRHDSPMPDILPRTSDVERVAGVDRRAIDLAAYLSTRTIDAGERSSSLADISNPVESAEAGRRLFATIGCAACHQPCSTTEASGDSQRAFIALDQIAEKWRPEALFQYLLAPERHFAWTRMPNFRLSTTEAQQLAMYLLQESTPSSDAPIPDGDPVRGRRLLTTLGCLNCHEAGGGHVNEFDTIPLADLHKSDWSTSGCVADDHPERGTVARFALADDDRDSLIALGSTDLSSLRRQVPSEFASRQVRRLNCAACHARDGEPASCRQLVTEELSDTLREQAIGMMSPPPLTYVGAQLQTDWTRQLFAGEVRESVRPWISIRMPSFPSRAEPLAIGLAAEHGLPPTEPASESTETHADALLAHGEALFGAQRGFSCFKCHSVGTRKALMEVELGVVDLAKSHDRLRPEFYLQWMTDPTRLLPGTKMPAYSDHRGQSPIRGILEGDSAAQFDAIWSYIDSLKSSQRDSL